MMLSYDIIVVFPFRRDSFRPMFNPFCFKRAEAKGGASREYAVSKTSLLMSPNFSTNTFLKVIVKIHILSPTESL